MTINASGTGEKRSKARMGINCDKFFYELAAMSYELFCPSPIAYRLISL